MSHLRTIAENIEKTIGRGFRCGFFPVVSERVNKLQRAFYVVFSLRKTLFGEKFKWFEGNFLCLSPMASLKLYFLIVFLYTKRERNMCGVRAFSGKCVRRTNILPFLTGLQVISGLWFLLKPRTGVKTGISGVNI